MALPNATEAFGRVSFWGFSSALDFSSYFAAMTRLPVSNAHYNILLLGAGDIRHIIKTTTSLIRSKDNATVHFYIIEKNIELLARHILFLTLINEPVESLGIQEKTELFLELFANLHIRQKTLDYLRGNCSKFVDIITNMELKYPYMDMALLKFKERDQLANIFNLWLSSPKKPYDAKLCWENRIRDFLRTRYDSRSGVYDWDYSMKILDVIKTISSYEYSWWRETGNAFVLHPDAAYICTNFTLATDLIMRRGGDYVTQRGYWGDTIVSPYITFGAHTTREDLVKTASLPNSRCGQLVCVENLQYMLQFLLENEANTNSELSSNDNNDNNNNNTSNNNEADETGLIKVIEESNSNTQDPNQDDVIINLKPTATSHVEYVVHFLPLSFAETIHTKSNFRNFFSLIYYSMSMTHLLKSEICTLFATHSAGLILETPNYMIGLTKDQQKMYKDKIMSMATSMGFLLQIAQPDHLFFTPSEEQHIEDQMMENHQEFIKNISNQQQESDGQCYENKQDSDKQFYEQQQQQNEIDKQFYERQEQS